MRTLAIVPARAGSKGLPGKNKRDFCGKPLVSWAIEVGKRTCDWTVVTSDDPDVLRIAERLGVEAVKRPLELAQDDNPILAVMLHALHMRQRSGIEVVVLLQPTQPLRTDAHVKQAIAMLLENDGVDSVVTVAEFPRSCLPDKAVAIKEGRLVSLLGSSLYATRRWNDCREAYYRDGTAYVMRVSLLESGEMYGHSLPLVIPRNETCDIDMADDWRRAEQMWEARQK